MIKNFKFFHGYSGKLRALWNMEHQQIDAAEELSRVMSSQIAREIDSEILNRITRLINGGGNQDGDYLNFWMNIGNRA